MCKDSSPTQVNQEQGNKEHEYAGKQMEDLITHEKHLFPSSLDRVVIFIHFFFSFFFKVFSVLCFTTAGSSLCVCAAMCLCAGLKNTTNLKRMGTVSGTWP